ncbi:MAG TPA: PEP-CTERM sorting domain-containing protein [Pirellulaceae bacterium]|nr:PEP-CTERM sorting domain-containing protein [Pirellulaceae bacterium]
MNSFRYLQAVFLVGIVFSLVIGSAASVRAQFVMMPDSTNNRMVLFSPLDGSVVNPSLFSLAAGTPIHAMQVGNEIWVSEQVGDRVSRWDFSGNALGAITGGLDNIRGMGRVGNTIYVTNAGTANGAPGAAVVMFDTAGNNLGFFSTVGTAPSPFGVLPHLGGILVSSSSANDDIHRYTTAGASLGTFHNSTQLNFAEQMAYRNNGNVLVAGFSSPSGVFELDVNTGAILNSWAPNGGQRGVYQLANGNILWTNGSGAHVLDPNTGISTQVYIGGGRYLDYVDFNVIPEPGSGLIFCVAVGLGMLMRRRQR